MLLDIIRFLRGSVEFGVSGRFPERFINITSRNDVRLWRVQRRGEGITAAMYRADYRRIRPLARAAGVRLSVIGKHGLPAGAFRFRDRLGLAIGAFVFILTVFVMSRFIWSIDITGLETVSESELRALLSAHGLSVGAFTPGIDADGVSRAVMLDEGRIGWMAVNISGSCASVEVKEETPAPEIPDYRRPANVKARRDGTVRRIEAREGVILLKEGSGVVAGQLVVSGVVEHPSGAAQLVRADAVIIAATRYEAQFSVPFSTELLLPSGERGERRTLRLFGLSVPLSGYAADASLSAVSDRLDCLQALDTVLPLGVVTEQVMGMEQQSVRYDYYSAKELLTKQAQLYEVFSLAGCTVTDRRLRLSRSNGGYVLRAVYDCEEDIAVQVEIGTE